MVSFPSPSFNFYFHFNISSFNAISNFHDKGILHKDHGELPLSRPSTSSSLQPSTLLSIDSLSLHFCTHALTHTHATHMHIRTPRTHVLVRVLKIHFLVLGQRDLGLVHSKHQEEKLGSYCTSCTMWNVRERE